MYIGSLNEIEMNKTLVESVIFLKRQNSQRYNKVTIGNSSGTHCCPCIQSVTLCQPGIEQMFPPG